ncbi:hypothetical protein H8L32_09020 [Undibacterium sp. CY18W]|uniref:Uncharacterized protein n=1 Tax=Undibacterium hunanense TaxID=2762292 RepID=A0ABR6ZNZ3_9BURK|nr:hypothetical protein [Undibacterium hunanense]MBC3917611.1 hypothetical protein [Undibacterium hunanense]
MRRISCDYHELGNADYGSVLNFIISSPVQHGDLTHFLAACQVDTSKAIGIMKSWPNHFEIVRNLKQFANIDLPHPSQWRESLLFQDEWNECEVAINVGDTLIWYCWSTSS